MSAELEASLARLAPSRTPAERELLDELEDDALDVLESMPPDVVAMVRAMGFARDVDDGGTRRTLFGIDELVRAHEPGTAEGDVLARHAGLVAIGLGLLVDGDGVLGHGSGVVLAAPLDDATVDSRIAASHPIADSLAALLARVTPVD